MRRVEDDCLYDGDAVFVAILIFGKRRCACCGHDLPRNADYFAPDKVNASGLVHECRRCRRAMERDRYAEHRERQVVSSGQFNLLGA